MKSRYTNVKYHCEISWYFSVHCLPQSLRNYKEEAKIKPSEKALAMPGQLKLKQFALSYSFLYWFAVNIPVSYKHVYQHLTQVIRYIYVRSRWQAVRFIARKTGSWTSMPESKSGRSWNQTWYELVFIAINHKSYPRTGCCIHETGCCIHETGCLIRESARPDVLSMRPGVGCCFLLKLEYYSSGNLLY